MSWEEARDVAKHPVVDGTIPTTEGHSPRSQQCQGIDTDSQGPPPRLSQVPGALLISGSLLQILELGRLGDDFITTSQINITFIISNFILLFILFYTFQHY